MTLPEDVDAESPLIKKYLDKDFTDVGYYSRYTILNLGSLYLITMFTLVYGLILAITKKVVEGISFAKVRVWLQNQYKGLFWNAFIRVIL
jgi:hypothetical protein